MSGSIAYQPGGSDQSRGASALAGILAAIVLMLFAMGTPRAIAGATDGRQAQAARLSDSAFGLLNSINAEPGKAGPMLAPVASLAGDAQTLSTAIGADDSAQASRAMAAILSDRDQIDSAAARKAGRLDRDQWDAIKLQIAALEKAVPPAKKSIERVAREPSVVAHAAGTATVTPPSMEKMGAAPKIKIASRVFKGATVHLKGYLEGTDLKSAGIYDGDQKTKDIEISPTPGEQRINFDFTIEQPPTTESIRVADVYGREAQAMVAPDRSVAGAMNGSEELIEVEPGASSGSGVATSRFENTIASAGPMPRNNTAEIPRPADARSPSRRHLDAGPSLAPLTGVEINVIDAEELLAAPGMVQVVGQISGAGVKRAGVYVNGRLAKSIPISTSGYSSFAVTFPMPAGSEARVRAYGIGRDFVEASIDTTGNSSGMTTFGNPPAYAPYPVYPASPYTNPYAYGRNPYANPYANPYGYPPQPYYGAPPYGYPAQPPKAPWWSKILH